MSALALAELIVLIHFLFILFVILGGLLVLKWRWLAWVHLPAAIWGVVIEVTGWICPLTPLENQFRFQAGQGGYTGEFISHYLIPLIYPDNLNANLQLVLAGIVVVINCVVYYYVFRKEVKYDSTDC